MQSSLKAMFASVFSALLLAGGSVSAQTLELENQGLIVKFDSEKGRLTSVTNRLTGELFEVQALPFRIETSIGTFEAELVTSSRRNEGTLEFQFRAEQLEFNLLYELLPDRKFLEKTVELRNRGPSPIVIHRIVLEQVEFEPSFEQIHPHRDPSLHQWLINLFLRSQEGGLYLGIENPLYEYSTRGATPRSSWIQLHYDPRLILAPNSSYTSDASFLGPFRREGVYLFKELQLLHKAVNEVDAIPSMINFDQEVLDWGEVWAMQDFMSAIQPPHDFERPGFYVRAVAYVGGRKGADFGREPGFHIAFEEEHVPGSKRFVDEIAELGHIPHIEWATEWYGLGGYANPTEELKLERAGPGDPVPVNPYWREVVEYGWEKGIQTGIFETVGRDFASERLDWKVMLRDGSLWTWREELPVNCWANGEFVGWRLEVTDEAVRDFKLYMVAYDAIVPADWAWLGWPDIRTECFAEHHGHLPGDIRYPLFRNIQWYLEELQRRHPKLALRVASGLTPFYPWILKNLIEYHPNYYDGETGATYWTSYNFRFLPMYKSGVLLSAPDRHRFEWMLLRSISVSDHFMLWPDALPVALENRDFWTRWITWADRNIDYLRVGRTLFREPWGDNIVASLPPALEGRLPAPSAKLHGSAHVIGDRGYLFVFNPSTSSARVGVIPINNWIGLTDGAEFRARFLYPEGNEIFGPYQWGQDLHIEIPSQSAVVLELNPNLELTKPTLIPYSKDLPVDKAFLGWKDIPWEELHPVPVRQGSSTRE